MPSITFIPYVEGDLYDASSLNVNFSSVEAGLNAIPSSETGDNSIGIFQAPSLAGYMERTSSPQTPHLIAMEAPPSLVGPPAGAYDNDGNAITFTHNLANTPWPHGVLAASSSPLESDPDYWQVATVGNAATLPLEAHFHDDSTVIPGNNAYAFPLFLRRDTALAQGATFAQGLIVQANIEFNCLDWRNQDDAYDGRKVSPATRCYMAFCIQVLSQWPDYPVLPAAAPKWYIVPRTIRFVSDKVIPKIGFENDGNPGTPIVPPAAYPQVTRNARFSSSIDIPIRTVIRREDFIAAGFGGALLSPPLLGVRVAVGKWEVGFGPVQPGSFANTPTDPIDEDPYAGGPLRNGDGLTTARLCRGNLNLFPIHAASDVTSFVGE